MARERNSNKGKEELIMSVEEQAIRNKHKNLSNDINLY